MPRGAGLPRRGQARNGRPDPEGTGMDAEPDKPRTRIQIRNREAILEAALEVFSQHGFRGATVDMIAAEAGLSKPNLLYYFPTKEDIHVTLLSQLMDSWLAPLRELDETGDPVRELLAYMRRKLEMSRDLPRGVAPLRQRDPARRPAHRPVPVDRAQGAGRRQGPDHRGLVGRGPHRGYRSPSPDLLDLGADPALRRFRGADRRAGARGRCLG
jgi:AcrR family transcriptional regulator